MVAYGEMSHAEVMLSSTVRIARLSRRRIRLAAEIVLRSSHSHEAAIGLDLAAGSTFALATTIYVVGQNDGLGPDLLEKQSRQLAGP